MTFFININQLRTLVSNEWRLEFSRTGSLIHQLFAKEIAFTEFEYGEKVVTSLATDKVINRTRNPNIDFKSNYATIKKIEATLFGKSNLYLRTHKTFREQDSMSQNSLKAKGLLLVINQELYLYAVIENRY